MNEVIGKVKFIGLTQDVSASFKKREIVVTTEEQYPQHISIEFQQDKTSLLDNYVVGQDVKVHINLRGREWVNPEGVTKYFNGIQGWRIEKNGDVPVQEPGQAQPPVQNEMPPATDFKEEEHDDLPF